MTLTKIPSQSCTISTVDLLLWFTFDLLLPFFSSLSIYIPVLCFACLQAHRHRAVQELFASNCALSVEHLQTDRLWVRLSLDTVTWNTCKQSCLLWEEGQI